MGLVIALEKVKILISLFGTRKHRLIEMGEVTLSFWCLNCQVVFGSEA